MFYYHVDVFCKDAFSGNGLTVILLDAFLSQDKMQNIAKEFKQFETIFIVKRLEGVFDARIFTVEEELYFAGHPILGAAAVVLQKYFSDNSHKEICFQLKDKTVVVQCSNGGNKFQCAMNQGKAEFLSVLSPEIYNKYIIPLNLKAENLSCKFPLEVVSTGLPYLIIPVVSGLGQAKITTNDYESLLADIGAKFVYIFDMNTMEGRTWDNLGIVEDVATGSAAGSVGAYLYKHNVFSSSEKIVIKQGGYVGRESEITIHMQRDDNEVWVSGDAVIVVQGEFNVKLAE